MHSISPSFSLRTSRSFLTKIEINVKLKVSPSSSWHVNGGPWIRYISSSFCSINANWGRRGLWYSFNKLYSWIKMQIPLVRFTQVHQSSHMKNTWCRHEKEVSSHVFPLYLERNFEFQCQLKPTLGCRFFKK